MSDSKTDRLHSYLESQLENGKHYFKSRDVAEDIPDLSSKQVGTLFRKLKDEEPDCELDISKWTGGSKAVTWHVSRA